MIPPTTTISLSNKLISPNGNVAVLEYDCPKDFVFSNGQFVQFQLIINQQLLKRSYSILNSYQHLQQSGKLQFLVKKTPGGMGSNRLVNEQLIGEQIQIVGPLGHLIISEQFPLYIFIGTGSGIAPLLSIYTGLEGSIHKQIIFGESVSGALVPALVDIVGTNNIILSREQTSPYQFGHVQDVLDKLLTTISDRNQVGVFLCGKPAMVEDVKNKLISADIPSEHIKDERY